MATPGNPTDLATLQRRVDESVGTVKRVFEAASDCMAIVGAQEGRFLAANPAFEALTGYPFGELQWMHLWELWRPDMTAEARVVFRQILETGSGSGTEIPLLRKSGTIVTAEFAARTMKYQGQDALLSIMVDITDRKSAQRRDAQLENSRAVLQAIRSEALVATEKVAALSEQANTLTGDLSSDPEWSARAEALLESVNTVVAAVNDVRARVDTALAPPSG